MWTNVDEIETAIQNFAATYPAIAEWIVLPEQAVSAQPGVAPRTMSALRIGAQPAGAVDAVLFIFGQHAREWVPPEVALELAAGLLEAYSGGLSLTYGGKSYTVSDVQRIVDNMNVFLVPCMNPQGRQFSLDNDVVDAGWRKNRNSIPGSAAIGVDLNRNYDIVFDLDKYFDLSNPQVLQRTSDQPDEIVFQGRTPFSEPETRNVRWLLDTYSRIRRFIDVHGYTSSGEIYYPWGHDENQTDDPAMNWRNPAFDHQRGWEADAVKEYIGPGDLATHRYLAERLKAGADPVNGRSYFLQQSFGLYPVAGSSEDYAWSRHFLAAHLPRVEGFVIEHRSSQFKPPSPEREDIIREVTSGLINFCLACACGVPGLSVELATESVVFNQCPVGRTSSRPVVLRVTGCETATFRRVSGPTRTGGSANIQFGIAVAQQIVPAAATPTTRELFVWLTCWGGLDGEMAEGTVRVECPEAGFVQDVAIVADFVAPPPASAVLVLDRSGSMAEDGGDGRTRLQVLLDSAPAFVDVAPQGTRVGLVRFATDEAPGAPMTELGPEGPDPAGRGIIRDAISDHTLAVGDAQYTSIGDGVFAGNDLMTGEPAGRPKSLVVLTDGHENRDRWLTDVAGIINDRVFAIGLGTPELIQPIALQALTNGHNGYLLMTGELDVNDPHRLAKYYLQILTGVTNDQVVLDPGGWLPFGGSQAVPFYLNEADASVDAIVLTPFPQLLRIRLEAPSGQILDETHPAMTFTRADGIGYYRFAMPVPGAFSAEGPGRWRVLIDWRKRPTAADRRKLANGSSGISQNAVRYDVLVHARSDLEMVASLTQDRLTPGARVTVRARLTQFRAIPIDDAKVVANIVFPDGSAPVRAMAPLGDGVFQAEFEAPLAGIYTVRITAEGRTLRGLDFTREAVRTAIAWEGGGGKPPTRRDEGWCATLRCLIESGAIDRDLVKRLGLDLDRLAGCCREEEEPGPRSKERPR